MRAKLTLIWELRRSPKPAVRAAWWLSCAILLFIVFHSDRSRTAAMILWAIGNAALLLTSIVWACFHPRSLWRLMDIAFRWAGVITAILGPVLYYGLLNDASGGQSSSSAMLVPSGMLVLVVFVLVLVFPLLLLVGAVIAALSAFVGRRRQDSLRGRRMASGAVWTTLALGGILQAPRFPSAVWTVGFWILIGAPAVACFAYAFTRKSDRDPHTMVGRLLSRIGRRLKVQYRRGGRVHAIDLRGPALGAVGALTVAFVIAPGIRPLQASALVQLIQFYNGATLQGVDQVSALGWMAPIQHSDANAALSRENIVLLHMDEPVRRSAMTERSEAAVQTDMIRKLSAWKVRAIVLPMPQMRVPKYDAGEFDSPYRAPVTDAEIKRNLKDQAALTAVVRSSGVTMIAVSDTHDARAPGGGESLERHTALIQAARSANGATLGSYGSARVPTILVDPLSARTAVPVALLPSNDPPTANLNASNSIQYSADGEEVNLNGRPFPMVSPGAVLVDFRDARPDADFETLPYSSVLNNESIYSVGRAWVAPETMFRDKIVLLDSIVPRLRETPVGMMSRQEALAYAISTLQSGTTIRHIGSRRSVLISLLLGLLVGGICTRRTPFDALWRTALLLVLIYAVAITVFTFLALWIDPVAPSLAVAASYVLSTQFAFKELEKNRKLLNRIASPEVVGELLDSPEELHLGGTKLQVCVLFADVRNFTEYAEAHDPQVVIEAVNAYMTVMTDALDRHRGILDKYTGDGLMAFFRVKTAGDGDVKRAVTAAVAMSDAALELSIRRTTAGLTPLAIGIGLHYGEAVVGLVGNEERQVNYTAIGITVNVSARLQMLAAGGDVIISESVYNALDGTVRIEAREPVHVKGVRDMVRPYRVLRGARK